MYGATAEYNCKTPYATTSVVGLTLILGRRSMTRCCTDTGTSKSIGMGIVAIGRADRVSWSPIIRGTSDMGSHTSDASYHVRRLQTVGTSRQNHGLMVSVPGKDTRSFRHGSFAPQKKAKNLLPGLADHVVTMSPKVATRSA